MKVVVTGASANVGTSVPAALGREPKVTEIVGLARRLPDVEPPKVRWVAAGVTETPPAPIFEGADAVVHLAWEIHLQSADAGWIDLALGVPLMDTGRARRELGWEPRKTSLEALAELLAGLRRASGGKTPPLDPKAGGPLRAGEFATGVGSRNRAG